MLAASSLLTLGRANAAIPALEKKNDAIENITYNADSIDYKSFIDIVVANICHGTSPEMLFDFMHGKQIILDNGLSVRVNVRDIVINSILEFDNNALYNADYFCLKSRSLEMTRLIIPKNCDYYAGVTDEYYDPAVVGRYINALNRNSAYNIIHELGHAMDYFNPRIKHFSPHQFIQFKIYSEFARRAHVLMLRGHVLEKTGSVRGAFPFADTYVDKFLTTKESKLLGTPYFWREGAKNAGATNKIKEQAGEPYLSCLLTGNAGEDDLVAAVISEFGKNYNRYTASIAGGFSDDFNYLGGNGLGVSEQEFSEIISQIFAFYIDGESVVFPMIQNGKFKQYVDLIMGQKSLQKVMNNAQVKMIDTGRDER